ncbi:hypothetical protein SISSUDRAFT_1035371 [Sistotremastrum suecicum HHB10207 ss-3]|uniref:Uncharacterized protein n=1 Tax=Sistotremastrum suecicum HHB10207 ss-3 TaxID=1314776 RepID=A0A166AVL0_9AGAM|nr:hypothetical protein SISSUDRAFT_1035371 [Sistotremastrum suecicum HHB10207 ss-3]
MRWYAYDDRAILLGHHICNLLKAPGPLSTPLPGAFWGALSARRERIEAAVLHNLTRWFRRRWESCRIIRPKIIDAHGPAGPVMVNCSQSWSPRTNTLALRQLPPLKYGTSEETAFESQCNQLQFFVRVSRQPTNKRVGHRVLQGKGEGPFCIAYAWTSSTSSDSEIIALHIRDETNFKPNWTPESMRAPPYIDIYVEAASS